jgi:hypothetical protein
MAKNGRRILLAVAVWVICGGDSPANTHTPTIAAVRRYNKNECRFDTHLITASKDLLCNPVAG